MSKFDELLEYLHRKDVAIIGNSECIFKTLNDIDSHEIVIRMNRGFPEGKEIHLGSRTDILCLSLPLTEEEIKKLDPKYLVWCTPKTEKMTDYIKKEAIQFPKEAWEMIAEELGARPSTGCMTVAMACNAGAITLYGFDFMKSPNWYTGVKHVGPHNYEKEEELVRDIVNEGWGEIR